MLTKESLSNRFFSYGFLCLIVCFFIACGAPIDVPKQEGLSLKATPGASVKKGNPFYVTFTLTNTSAKTIYVLNWHTPFEGIKNDFLKATRDGQVLEYNGPLVKRGNPSKADYKKIQPGKSISTKVDLSQSYDLTKAGKYNFIFSGKVMDHSRDASVLPRKIDAYIPFQLGQSTISFELN